MEPVSTCWDRDASACQVMPWSGSTPLGQVLASRAQLHGGGEEPPQLREQGHAHPHAGDPHETPRQAPTQLRDSDTICTQDAPPPTSA